MVHTQSEFMIHIQSGSNKDYIKLFHKWLTTNQSLGPIILQWMDTSHNYPFSQWKDSFHICSLLLKVFQQHHTTAIIQGPTYNSFQYHNKSQSRSNILKPVKRMANFKGWPRLVKDTPQHIKPYQISRILILTKGYSMPFRWWSKEW